MVVDREFRRGVSPVEPDGRPADETVRMSWPGARPVRLDRPTTVVPRVTASDDADDVMYEHGWEDGRRVWKRIAVYAGCVAVLSLIVAGAVIARWYEAVSQ